MTESMRYCVLVGTLQTVTIKSRYLNVWLHFHGVVALHVASLLPVKFGQSDYEQGRQGTEYAS